MKRTQAQQISSRYGNDGQCFTDAKGVDLADCCLGFDARRSWRDGFGTDVVRYEFPDGSAITVAGDGWDLGYTDCYCWRDVGHTEDCKGQ